MNIMHTSCCPKISSASSLISLKSSAISSPSGFSSVVDLGGSSFDFSIGAGATGVSGAFVMVVGAVDVAVAVVVGLFAK